jgi:hypothetical protein
MSLTIDAFDAITSMPVSISDKDVKIEIDLEEVAE